MDFSYVCPETKQSRLSTYSYSCEGKQSITQEYYFEHTV